MSRRDKFDKQRFDAIMSLAAFGAGRFDARRSYEWKLTLGLWFVLAAATQYFRVPNIPSWFGVATVVLYALWINKVRWSNYFDKALCDHYRKQAAEDLASAGVPPRVEIEIKLFVRISKCLQRRPWLNLLLGIFSDLSAMFQIAVTIVLVLAVYQFCQKALSEW